MRVHCYVLQKQPFTVSSAIFFNELVVWKDILALLQSLLRKSANVFSNQEKS